MTIRDQRQQQPLDEQLLTGDDPPHFLTYPLQGGGGEPHLVLQRLHVQMLHNAALE